MNENIEGRRTIYSHKTFLDCNYNQSKETCIMFIVQLSHPKPSKPYL